MTKDMQIALDALRGYAESSFRKEDGSKWASVYLDNAQPDGWSGHKWAGVLGALEKAGYYSPLDGYFGDVKIYGPVRI